MIDAVPGSVPLLGHRWKANPRSHPIYALATGRERHRAWVLDQLKPVALPVDRAPWTRKP
jgi:hypothetical protein